MTRLTKALRRQILIAAVAHKYPPSLDEALRVRRAQLARNATIEACGGKEQYDRMCKAHALAVTHAANRGLGSVRCSDFYKQARGEHNMGGERAGLRYSGTTTFGDCVYMLAGQKGGAFPADHELTLEWRAIEREAGELAEKREDALRAVESLLAPHSTLKKLLAEWPAAEQFLPPATATPATTLPAVRVAEVNALLGIDG